MDDLNHLAKVRVAGSNPVFRSMWPVPRRSSQRCKSLVVSYQEVVPCPSDMRGNSAELSLNVFSLARRCAALSEELGVSEATLHLWKRQALIDAGLKEGTKSSEIDELAQAHKTIAELEAELEITRAAVALFNGEEPVSPQGGARLPKA